jgi:hypothetical protein
MYFNLCKSYIMIVNNRFLNGYELIRIYNCNQTFYLTRQAVLDSTIIQDTRTFFYDILLLNRFTFNKQYEKFAQLYQNIDIANSIDLYLNVNEIALKHIINYVQTDTIDGEDIYINNYDDIRIIINLAKEFNLSKLVNKLESLTPTQEQLNKNREVIKFIIGKVCLYWEHIAHDNKNYAPPEQYIKIIEKCVEDAKEIIDESCKKSFHGKKNVPIEFRVLIVFIYALWIEKLCESCFPKDQIHSKPKLSPDTDKQNII